MKKSAILFGLLLLALGVFQKLRQFSLRKRILIPAGLFLLSVFVLFFADYVGVSVCNRLPVFCYATQSITPAGTGMITYHNPFYRVYRINVGTENEYRIIDTAKKYTEETVPFSPFNRNQCGISQLRKYKSPYIGDNSNTGGLINALPLSEHGFVFEIDAKNCGLTVNYHFTDWYGNNDGYVEKSLIYNSVSIFCLIDNVQYITYHFSGSTYRVTRADMEQNYPDFNEITASHQINEEAFHKYVEEKMTDEAFIRSIFTLFEKEQA